MRDAKGWESLQDVLKVARLKGCLLTRAKLHRWQLAGLIPQPVRRGRGRGLGTKTFYPPGTTEQAVAAGRYLKENRSLPAALFLLWWHGYQIQESKVRELLRTELLNMAQLRTAMLGRNERAASRFRKQTRTRTGNRLMRDLRKRVGRGDYETFLEHIGQVGAGLFKGFKQPHHKIMAARALDVPVEKVTWVFNFLAQLLDPHTLKNALDGAIWAEIVAARDELKSFLTTLGELAQLSELALGSNPASSILKSRKWPLGMYLQAVLVWLSVRKHPSFESTFREVLASVTSAGKPVNARRE